MAEQYSKLEWDEASGKWAPPTNRPGAPTLVWDGFNWQYGEDNPEGPGALSRGLATGMEGIKGAVVDLLPAMAQSTLGFDDAARRNLEEYAARFKELEKTGYLARTQFGDIKDVDSFLSWFGETLGQAAPSMVPVAGGAGAGAVVGGRLLAGAATKIPGPVATALTRNTLKETTEALVARGIARNEAAGIAAKNLAQMAGAAGGAFAGGWIQNAPESFKEIFDETGELRPGLAAGLGTIKSALDTVGPVALLSKVKGAQFADQVKSRIAGKLLEGRPGAAGALGGVIGGLAVEGLTEGTQALVDELALAALNDKSIDWDKIFENFAAGAAVGSVVGGVGGAIAGRRQAQAQAQVQAQEQAQAQAQAQAQQENLEYQSQVENLVAPEPTPTLLTPEELQSAALKRTRAQFPYVPFLESGDIDYKTLQDNLRQAASTIPEFERPSVPKVVADLKKKIAAAYAKNKTDIAESNRRQVESLNIRAQAQEQQAAIAQDQDLVDRVNQDPSILQADPALTQEYREALARVRLRQEEAQRAAQADEEILRELNVGPFPPRGTSAEIQRAEPAPPPDIVEETPAPTTLTREQRRNLEDLLGTLEPGTQVSIPVVQQTLKVDGKIATPSEAKEALRQYAPAQAQTSWGGDIVPAKYRLVQNAGRFLKFSEGETASPRPEARELPSTARAGRGFEGVTLQTEADYPPFGPQRMGRRYSDPSDSAFRYAQELPVGQKFNQDVLAEHLRTEGFRDVPPQTIAKIESDVLQAHPDAFRQGVKVAPLQPAPQSTKEEPASSVTRGGARLNVPPDADPTVVENAQKFQEESQKDSDSKSLLDTPYTCRT